MDKWQAAYMDVAHRFAQLSTATRLKVGAIAVKDDRIISIGYNGTPSGWDNECEDWVPNEGVTFEVNPDDRAIYGRMITKEEVIHAEANCIAKLARSTESGEGATMYITHAPCLGCAKQIYGAGVTDVYYRDEYQSLRGIEFLVQCGVGVYRI